MDEADRLADRIGIIDHGELLVLDTPQGLKNRIGAGDIMEITLAEGQADKLNKLRPTLPDSLRDLAFQAETLRLVGRDTLEVLPVLLEKLQQAQVEIQDISIRKKTLEDVFIDLTGRRLRA